MWMMNESGGNHCSKKTDDLCSNVCGQIEYPHLRLQYYSGVTSIKTSHEVHGSSVTYVSISIPKDWQTSEKAPEAEKIWRLASWVVGLLCFALSPSFPRLIRGWNTFKLSLYGLFSLILCVTVLCARKCSLQIDSLKAYLGFAVLMMISVYSYFYDKAVNGKPEILSLVSNASFALLSLCLSKLVKFGLEMGIFCFFLGCFTIQLVTIDVKLIFLAILVGCPLFIMHSSSDLHSRTSIQGQDSSSNSKPLRASEVHHTIDIPPSESGRGSMSRVLWEILWLKILGCQSPEQ